MNTQPDDSRPCLPVLMGPTGSGKTALIANLDPARYEIINVDSRQVYRELVIGAAAPEAEILNKIRHHLVGFLDPDQTIDAALFVAEALRVIPQILDRGRIPLLVGGTGFYYRALHSGGLFQVEIDPALKSEIKAMTVAERLQALQALDPKILVNENEQVRAGKIHPNDDYRIGRALEIKRSTGRSMQDFWADATIGQQTGSYRFKGWWLELPREQYWSGLELRAEAMVRSGLVAEAGAVFEKYGDCAGLTGIGYPEALAVWRGESTEQQLVEQLYIAHRQYGKRQRTWFRRESSLEAIQPAQFEHCLARHKLVG